MVLFISFYLLVYNTGLLVYAFHPQVDVIPEYPLSDLSKSDDLVPEERQNGSYTYFDKTGYDFEKDVEVNKLHPDGYNNIDFDGCEEVIKKCFQTFRAWGMTPEGAAAICGNIKGESGGDPSAFGADFAYSWNDERVLDSNGKYAGFKRLGQKYDSVDFGFGLIGFTADVLIQLVFYIAAHEGKEFTDLSVQLLALSYMYGARCQKHEEMVNSTMFKPFYDENDDGMGLIHYLNWDKYVTVDLSGSGAENKIKRLTAAYMANCEACLYDGSSQRSEEAIKCYNKYKDLEPYDYGEDKAGVAQNPSDNDNSGDGSSNNGSRVDLSGIVSEWDLTGMPSQSGLVEDLVNPHLADSSDIEKDFTVKQLYSIHEINKSKELQNEFDAWTKARVVIVFFGLLFIVYAILLMLALMFDKVNNIFDFSLLSIFTLGKIQYSNDILVKEEKSKFTTGKRVIISIVVLFVVGCIFISGGVLPAVMKGIYNVYNGVGSLFSGG